MKVVILGSSEMLYSMIDGVLKSNSEIVGVVNWCDVKKKKFFSLFKPDYVKKRIKELKLPLIKIKSVNSSEFKSALLKINPDLLLVGTWGEKIKKEIFDIPKLASINIHPSLLPKYRGPNPYSRVIMQGEKKTGVTFHLLSEKFDAGAILLQKEVEILPMDNSATLKTRICNELPEHIFDLITKLEKQVIVPLEQIEEDSTYYSHVDSSEIIVEPTKMTYQEIHDKIRGLAPWQSAYLLYKGIYFKIYDYAVVSSYVKRKKSNLCLKTKDNKFIYFKNLKAFGSIKKYFTSIILNHLHR